MLENGLVLVKPDCVDNNEFWVALYDQLESSNIRVIKRYSRYLSKKQILYLWCSRCLDDLIFSILLTMHLEQKKTIVIEVTGEQVFAKLKAIKTLLRKKHATSWLDNCIHTPDNKEEYALNYAVLNNLPLIDLRPQHTGNPIENEFIQQYLDGNLNELNEAVNNLRFISKLTLKTLRDTVRGEYVLIVVYREDYTLTLLTALLFSIIPNIDINQAVILSDAIVWFGEFPVFYSNERQELVQLQALFTKQDILSKINTSVDIVCK